MLNKTCSVCSVSFKVERNQWKSKYCQECRFNVKRKYFPRKMERLCFVCKLPSFGRKHKFCEFQSLLGARSRLSNVNNGRRYNLKQKLIGSNISIGL